jgi:hypothetical protein
MNKEQLRMQMLAGVITEGEYKAKLNENLSDLEVKWLKDNLEKYYEKGLADDFETMDGKKVKEIIGYFEDEDGDEDADIIGIISSKTGNDIGSYSEDDLDDAFMNALGNITEGEHKAKLNEDEFTTAMNVQAVINKLLNMEGGQEALKLLEKIDEWNELVDMAVNM